MILFVLVLILHLGLTHMQFEMELTDIPLLTMELPQARVQFLFYQIFFPSGTSYNFPSDHSLHWIVLKLLFDICQYSPASNQDEISDGTQVFSTGIITSSFQTHLQYQVLAESCQIVPIENIDYRHVSEAKWISSEEIALVFWAMR